MAVHCSACYQVVLDDHLAAVCPHFPADLPHAFAAFVDAITHSGPAKVSRFPRNVCSHPYAHGLDVTATDALLAGATTLLNSQTTNVPTVRAEPKVRRYFLAH